jgi:hypothetical protein
VVVAAIGLAAAGCGPRSSASRDDSALRALRALRREARPIGWGVRFHEPVRGEIRGPCRPRLGARIRAHIELFAADKVVLIPAGIGVSGPTTHLDGRITGAACYGDLVTLDPTGVVLIRPRHGLTLQALFAEWGQPLSSTRIAAFSAAPGDTVSVFVGGQRRMDSPSQVELSRHAEVVLELGPHVPPHRSFRFPPGD